MTSFLTLLFLCACILSFGFRIWLSNRHIHYIQEHRNTVPAAFAERVTLEAHQKAADYTIDRTRFGQQGILVEAALLLAMTLGGVLQMLHHFWSAHLTDLSYGIAMIGSVMLISALIDLPLSWHRQFAIEQRHGFNRMTPRLFLADLAKQAMLGIVIGTPVILGVLWLMEAMGEYWWLHVWLFWSGFNLLMLFIYPTLIAPLFNKFSALEAGETRSRIEALLHRCGFKSNGLFVMDGSRRSSHGNAYFTGFGNNKRIVFFDTLLSRLSPQEIEAVLAHELGHFKHRHIIQRIVLMFAGALFMLYCLGQLIDAQAFYTALGIDTQPNTALGLLLFFMVVPVLTFPLTPLFSHLSRQHEFEADAYAAEHTSADDLIHALLKLYQDNASTLTPDPLHSLFYDSHPPASLRIAHLEALHQKDQTL